MKNQNTNNINRRKGKRLAVLGANALPRTAGMDGIRRMPKPPASRFFSGKPIFTVTSRTTGAQSRQFGLAGLYKKIPQAVPLILALLLAFGGGMWYALATPKSAALLDEKPVPQVEAAFTSSPIPLVSAPAQTKSASAVSNEVLFNTPLERLKDYLATAAAADQLEARKLKLHKFLADRNSPLEPQADLIAEQDHWKLILAISFAESTLGQKCFDFNCSGIGGNQIRSYKSFDNWILDFNRLLEKRYKDKTLQQMCGVYVQPCSPNWLLATGQILSALDQENIE